MDNRNATALAIIDKARANGALAFVGQGVSETVPLYKLEATEIHTLPENFHVIQGKMVFRKEVCDRISDASGISFIMADVDSIRAPDEPALGLPARTVFRGTAQGKTRLPDGTWRESAPETYDFDYVAKARAEAGPDDAKFKRLAIEYYKAGPMRAATGARLRVIRQLTGMPTAFDPKEIGLGKSFVFSRIVQNTDFILATPEGRAMAIAAATGVAAQLYGQRQGASVEPASSHDPAASARPAEDQATSAAEDDFAGPALTASAAAPADLFSSTDPRAAEREAAINALRDYLASGILGGTKAEPKVKLAIESPNWPLDGPEGLLVYLDGCKRREEALGKARAS